MRVFFKKQSVSFYISIISCGFALAGMIVFLAAMGTSKFNFKEQFTGWIITLSIFSILLLLLSLNITPQLKLHINAGKLANVSQMMALASACAALGGAAGLIVNAIAVEFAYTFFSSLYVGTVKADFMPAACRQAIAAIFLFGVALILVCLAGLFISKKDCKI